MLAALLLASLQTAPADPPQRFSILATSCPKPAGDEVLVCADPPPTQLPLPEERGPPDGPRRPTGGPRAALDAGDPGSCALRGCQVGVDFLGAGTAAVRLIGKLIDPDSCCERPGEATNPAMLISDLIGAAKRGKKPDKSNRIPIPLDAPLPSISGRLTP